MQPYISTCHFSVTDINLVLSRPQMWTHWAGR